MGEGVGEWQVRIRPYEGDNSVVGVRSEGMTV